MGTDGPVFDQFNLVVTDMPTSISFYRLLGIEIPETLPEWQDHHRSAVMPDGLELDFDSTESARKWDEGWSSSRRPGMGVLGFRFSSRGAVDDAYDRLIAAGHRSQQPPYDAFWGARYAVVEDPDGNAVGLMSPQDEAARRTPEAP